MCEHGRRLVDCPEPWHAADHPEATMPEHGNDTPPNNQAVAVADPTPSPSQLAVTDGSGFVWRQQLVEWREHLERQTAVRPVQATIPLPAGITVDVVEDDRLGRLLVIDGPAMTLARFGDLAVTMIGEALTR
jgi:hypothetical protein